ncbi:hypothetical protein LINGRAHAP2_LOCUS23110, partial [Linum grandiflorum]
MKKEHENQTINEVFVIDSNSSSSFWLQNAPEAKFAGKVLTAVAYYASKMTPIIDGRPIWFLPSHL